MSITEKEIDQARQDGVEAARRIEGAPNKFHPSCPLHKFWAEGFEAGQQEPRDINGIPVLKGDIVQISETISVFGDEGRDEGLLGIIGIVIKVDGPYGFLTRLCTGHYVRLLGHEVNRVGRSSCPEQTDRLFANISSAIFKTRTAIDSKGKRKE